MTFSPTLPLTDAPGDEIASGSAFLEKRDRRSTTGSNPLTAIRRKCLECQGDSRGVEECVSSYCVLWPYRFRSRPATARAQGRPMDPKAPGMVRAPRSDYPKVREGRSTYRVIRAFCSECIGEGRGQEIRECRPMEPCALWPYRFGCSPRTARRRGEVVDGGCDQ